MSHVATIAKDEWRYWGRSKLGIVASSAVAVLIVASLVSTVFRVDSERTTREDFQTNAQETFEGQPARHPHRMIHYGHYVFRVPAPLALIDPGVDAYAGSVMFLEGHRHNSAVFPPRYASAHAGPFSELTPAFTYQVFLPLLLIVLGFAGIPREREARTDYLLYASSITPTQIWMGKTLALIVAAIVSLVPLAIGIGIAVMLGESILVALWILFGYAIYLVAWVLLISAISAWSRSSAASLASSLGSWVVLCIILPPVASSAAKTLAPMDGKVATDLAVVRALRGTDDGHNMNDPSFNQLRAQVLEQYGVDDVAELPVNFRGLVAQNAETVQSGVLNSFAEEKMLGELQQLRIVHWLGTLSPTLAIKNFSVIAAGTDLRQHHNFLREAEVVRYNFVQKLNKAHIESLDYAIDMQRSNDHESSQRARISAAHWRMLDEVSVQPRPTQVRVWESASQVLITLLWCGLAIVVGLFGMQRRLVAGV